eukprot:COSAG06_NODE_7161_length_2603_cov_1.101837_1_plen_617_part_00
MPLFAHRELEDGPRTETLVLWRQGRGDMGKKTPFLLRKTRMPQYRRRRANLTHRDAWSNDSADLEQELTAAQANCMWRLGVDTKDVASSLKGVSVDAAQDVLEDTQATAQADPGKKAVRRHLSEPGRSLAPGGGSASGDTEAEAGFKRVKLTGVPKIVVSSEHQCKLTLREWRMKAPLASAKGGKKDPKAHLYGKRRGGAYRQPAPGNGLACRVCRKLCRTHGENASWHCRECKFDICNPCVESCGPWALVYGEAGETCSPVQRHINLTATYGVRKSGPRRRSKDKKQVAMPQISMGVKQDVDAGTVLAFHQSYGHMTGCVKDQTLLLVATKAVAASVRARARGAEPEPEPEPAAASDDSGTEEEEGAPPDVVRCVATIFQSGDARSWVLAGEFHNVPNAPEPVAFTATAIGPAESESEEDSDSSSDDDDEESSSGEEDEDDSEDDSSADEQDSDEDEDEDEEEEEEEEEDDDDDDDDQEDEGAKMSGDGMPPRVRIRVSGTETDSPLRLTGRGGASASTSRGRPSEGIPDTRYHKSPRGGLQGVRMTSTDEAVKGRGGGGGGGGGGGSTSSSDRPRALGRSRMTSTDEAVRGRAKLSPTLSTTSSDEDDDEDGDV